MKKEEILKQVNFDLNKAKQIHQWLNEAPEGGAQAETRKPVSIHYDEDGNPDGILIQTLDEAFILALHDEGEMDYEKAKAYELPTAKQAHIYGAYLDEINEALDEAGGDRLQEDWYWTKTPSAYYVGYQLLFYGTSGLLNNDNRYYSLRVRVSLALNTANS